MARERRKKKKDHRDINRLHRTNLIIVWVGSFALTGTTLTSWPLNTITPWAATATMLVSAIVGTIAYKFVKTDLLKGLIIITAPAVASLVYAMICGGNAQAFLADYLFLAMTTQYFDTRYLQRFTVIFGIPAVVFLFINPKVIDGAEGSFIGALIKELIFFFISFALNAAVERGRSFLDESEKTLAIVQESGQTVNAISNDLNSDIVECRSNVKDLAADRKSVV